MDTSPVKATISLKWFKRPLPKKVKTKDQALFLQNLFELLSEGFSLNQALVFMELLMPQYRELIKIIVQSLEQGAGLERGLRQIGFSLDIVAQIFYGQKQGRFHPALQKCSESLKLRADYRQKIVKTLTYPIVMFVFLIALLLGMRIFLLPHILSFISVEVYQNTPLVRLLVLFFSYLPQILISLFAISILGYFFIDVYLLRKSAMHRYKLLLKIPLFNKWIRYYCTYKVAQNLGYFLEGGFSLQQTFDFIVQYPIDPFLTEVAAYLTENLKKGEALSDSLNALRLFQPELGMIVYQGELTSQLSTKCLLFSNKLVTELMEDVAKKINYLQPILFILIALLVMGMYLMMMLPILTMEGL